MTNIVPGDLIKVAMTLEDIARLNDFCDLAEKSRSEVVAEAVKQYLSIHGPLFEMRERLLQFQKEFSGNYEVPIPGDLQ